MEKYTTKQKYTAAVLLAFVSIILFFNIDSAWADSHHINGIVTAVAVLTGIGAIYILGSMFYKQYKEGQSTNL